MTLTREQKSIVVHLPNFKPDLKPKQHWDESINLGRHCISLIYMAIHKGCDFDNDYRTFRQFCGNKYARCNSSLTVFTFALLFLNFEKGHTLEKD